MRFRLRSAHYFPEDYLLMGDKENEHLGNERGTIVGDGTPYKVTSPTTEMVPLDEEAEEALALEIDRVKRNGSMNPVDQLPLNTDAWETRNVPGFPGVKR